MNPEGGPQEASATDTHRQRANSALAELDETRRIEYFRKKTKAEIDDRIEKTDGHRLGNKINANLGWPFNQNLIPQKKEPAQATTDPQKEKAEMVDRERTIFGTIKLKEGEDSATKPVVGPVVWEEGYFNVQGPSVQLAIDCDDDDDLNDEFETNLKATLFDLAKACLSAKGRDVSSFKEDNIMIKPKNSAKSFHIRIAVQDKVEGDHIIDEQIFSETKLQGILKKKLSVTSLPKSFLRVCPIACMPDSLNRFYSGGMVWTGPEENPTLLDQLIWKPISSIAPVRHLSSYLE
eukprot:765283-Hanusia_phi.AAC.9